MVVQIKLGIMDQSEAKSESKVDTFHYTYLVCLFCKTIIRVGIIAFSNNIILLMTFFISK